MWLKNHIGRINIMIKKSDLMVFVLLLSIILSMPSIDGNELQAAALDPADKVGKLTVITTTPEYDSKRYEAAKMIAENWKKIGLDAEVKPLDFTVLNLGSRSAPWNFDAVFMTMSGRTERLDPDMFIRSTFHSSESTDKGNNRVGLNDPAFDKLSDDQRSEMDPVKRRELILKAQDYVADQAVLFTLWYPLQWSAANKEKFKGYVEIPGEAIYNEWTPVMVQPLTTDKTLKVAIQNDVDNLNIIAAVSTWNWKVLRLVYDKLVRIGPKLQPVPAAAEKWKVVEPTVIDVTLREGMTFHDGKPVTSEDVKFTFDYMMKWKFPYLKAFVEPIKEVKISDKRTIRFILKKPFAPFISNTLGTIPILPKHVWDGVVEKNGLKSPEEWKDASMIGSGPFKFVHWKKGEEVKLQRFDKFYAPAKIDALIQLNVGNAEAVLGSLETRRADMVGWELSPAHAEMATKISHLQTFKTPDIGWTYMGLNIRRIPFNDKSLRQAIAHTIDYKSMIELLLDGQGTAGNSGKVISPAVKYFYSDRGPTFNFSLEKAKKILGAAGYRWDGQGKLYYPAKKK
jgi:peptide/nickel transport system substrate-binding protein